MFGDVRISVGVAIIKISAKIVVPLRFKSIIKALTDFDA